MAFDYEAPDTADPSSVADEIRAAGKLPPLSDEERLRRWETNQAFLEEQAWRLEQQRAASERKRAESAAIAAAQVRERLQRETRERIDRESRRRQRERELADLKLSVRQHQAWQTGVENAARKAIVRGQDEATMNAAGQILGALHRSMNPPPAPEPEVVYIESDEDPTKLSYPELHRWF